jgi:hypothetical protein
LGLAMNATIGQPVMVLTHEDLQALINAAAQAAAREVLKDKPAVAPELWTADQVSTYLACSKYHFSQDIATQRGFPLPVMLSAGPRAMKRWPAAEVVKWAERRRG